MPGLFGYLKKAARVQANSASVLRIFFIAANLVIDLIISLLDPRLRFKEAR